MSRIKKHKDPFLEPEKPERNRPLKPDHDPDPTRKREKNDPTRKNEPVPLHPVKPNKTSKNRMCRFSL
jgi:hypothetical protein